jgi:hypothetical protein
MAAHAGALRVTLPTHEARALLFGYLPRNPQDAAPSRMLT